MARRLSDIGIEVLPIPAVDLEELVRRATSRRRPFNDAGNGFRDNLIWHTVLELAGANTDEVVFVSNDKAFWDDGDLHSDLLEELADRDLDARVSLMDALPDLVIQSLLDRELATGESTKPALATQMIGRALDAGVPASWVVGDEVYGANPTLRAELEGRGIGYVLAVACDHPVQAGGATHRADALLTRVPARAWQQVSCGNGAKGQRFYDWAFLRLDHDGSAPGEPAPGERWLMIRRNHTTGELAFYCCWMPRPVPLTTLVRVAGARWTVEERFQTSKGLVGLDQHQVRRHRSWYRWVTLAMLAHAFLVMAALTERTRRPPPPELVPLTCNEVQHLFAALIIQPIPDAAHQLCWSVWRRRHQARARTCHYRRQANRP